MRASGACVYGCGCVPAGVCVWGVSVLGACVSVAHVMVSLHVVLRADRDE